MMPGSNRSFHLNVDNKPPAGASALPSGLRLVPMRPQHVGAATHLMADAFIRREPMTRALVDQESGGGLVRRAIGQLAGKMMQTAALEATSLAVVASDGTVAAVCANYALESYQPPAFPAPIAPIGALLETLYLSSLPAEAGPGHLDVGILAVGERFTRQGLATHLLHATAAYARAAGFCALTAGATSVSQDVFAACRFQSWGNICYDAFQHAGTTPFAAVQSFSLRYPVPAAHLMGRQLAVGLGTQ